MICPVRNCLTSTRFLVKPLISCALFHASSESSMLALPVESSHLTRSGHQVVGLHDIDILVGKVRAGSGHNEVFGASQVTKNVMLYSFPRHLVDKLLHWFSDWKSALGAFRWVASRPGYKHSPQAYDTMVDILM